MAKKWMDQARQSQPEPPRGIFPARVDDKGRLKLPVAFQQYLNSLNERLFVTTLDKMIARIYPMSVWRENEALFDVANEDPDGAADVSFFANVYGAESDIDAQGRVLIHPELRRALGIENQPVYLDCFKGRLNVYSQTVYDERMARANERLADKLKMMEQRGLK